MKTIDITKDLKKRARKEKVKQVVQATIDWSRDNKELAIVVATGAIGVLTAVTKSAVKSRNVRRVERSIQHRIWDPKEGTYWRLRRELTNDEKRYISREVSKGKNRGDVLERMKILR